MGHSRVIILSLSIAVLAVAASAVTIYGFRIAEASKTAEILVSYDSASISAWEDGDDLYFFMPSYFDAEDTVIYLTNGSFCLDGENVEEPLCVTELETGVGYSYSVIFREEVREGSLYIYSSGGVGTVFIETESGSMDAVDSDKTYREAGAVVIKDAYGNTECAGLIEYIKGRGNSTWQTDKKSYRFRLEDEADLFGMGSSKNWVLLSNISDGTDMLNKLALTWRRQSVWSTPLKANLWIYT